VDNSYVQWLQSPINLFFSIFILSLLIGSFLNVVILRYPIMMFRGWLHDSENIKNELPTHPALSDMSKPYNLSIPHSHCTQCLKRIKPWHNIPIFSYLFLRGKCAFCQHSISVRYVIIELLCAVSSVLILFVYPFSYQLLAMLFLTWTLITLSVIDIDYYILPDSITLPLLWVGILLNTQSVFVSLTDSVYGAAAGYLSLWSVYWLYKMYSGKEGMGHGDFKLLAALGAWFGWQMLPLIMLLSSTVGVIIGVMGMLIYKKNKNIPIPFGPYLAIAGWIAGMFGPSIVNWYLAIL
jgi:leader peptidase (prepilin peptidase)/N-methyltransferase